jgi:hypothetical protein
MKRARGITIVQLMVFLLIAGVVARFVVNFVIEKRCETNHTSALCKGRKAASTK